MWTHRCESLLNGRAIKLAIELDSSPVAYADVLKLWQNDKEFRSYFIHLLADAPYSAFRWETPPINAATAARPFELVLLDSPGLGTNPDKSAFAEHFVAAPDSGIVAFPNLGKDAVMVVPCPVGPLTAYGHLAAFVRQAPEAQKHALWVQVGAAMERRLNNSPVWLSTAGAGVSWLHVRLDDRRKYYGYRPYADLTKIPK